MKSAARDHIPRLVQSHHVHLNHHGAHLLGRLNAAVALKVSGLLGSMWFFWFCVLLDTAALVFGNPQSWSSLTWVAFASQTVIQLLALPVLGVMANIQQKASDARAEADHQTLSAIHTLTSRVDSVQDKQLELLDEIRKLGEVK